MANWVLGKNDEPSQAGDSDQCGPWLLQRSIIYQTKKQKGEFTAAMHHLSDWELKRKLAAAVQISINFTKRLLWEAM